MNAEPPVHRDERTVAVENASYRWAYLILSYGLLGAVAYRAFAHRENSWDLLALVVIGGAVGTAYQGAHRVLSSRWAVTALGALLAAAALAAVGAWLR